MVITPQLSSTAWRTFLGHKNTGATIKLLKITNSLRTYLNLTFRTVYSKTFLNNQRTVRQNDDSDSGAIANCEYGERGVQVLYGGNPGAGYRLFYIGRPRDASTVQGASQVSCV